MILCTNLDNNISKERAKLKQNKYINILSSLLVSRLLTNRCNVVNKEYQGIATHHKLHLPLNHNLVCTTRNKKWFIGVLNLKGPAGRTKNNNSPIGIKIWEFKFLSRYMLRNTVYGIYNSVFVVVSYDTEYLRKNQSHAVDQHINIHNQRTACTVIRNSCWSSRDTCQNRSIFSFYQPCKQWGPKSHNYTNTLKPTKVASIRD